MDRGVESGLLGGERQGGDEGVGRGRAPSPARPLLRQHGHPVPPVALGLRVLRRSSEALAGVPPLQKAGLNDIRRGPDP